jgi:hypothetical protein
MDNIIKKLFEAGLLSEDDQKSLQESFDARIDNEVSQIRETVESQLREEMAQRFEHDKATLVEAMDRMLTDVVQKYESEKTAEATKLREAQARYATAVKEARSAYKTRVQEHAKVLENFVMQKLSSELSEFAEDKNAVAQLRLKLAEANANLKAQYQARNREHAKVMESFIVKQLNSELVEFAEDKKAVREMKVKLAETNAANKAEYKKRLNENMSLMRKFVVTKLDEEMGKLRQNQQQVNEERMALVAQREQVAETLKQERAKLQEAMVERVAKIDQFVVGQVSKELREFQEDKKALVAKKVELVAEARAKLAETQRNFVREAAKLVDKKVTESMKVEMKQLHEDLERNRQNMFGRRIFEAVATEFMTSYFSEGTEVKKMEKVVEGLKQELNSAKRQINESQTQIEAAKRKNKLAEEAATRTRVLGELLAPLGREKRAVMQELLETVKTAQLKEAFNKYLPAVLNEGAKKVAMPVRQTLSETSVKPKSCVAITGDQRNNRLLETVQPQAQEDEVSSETAEILKLAGLRK